VDTLRSPILRAFETNDYEADMPIDRPKNAGDSLEFPAPGKYSLGSRIMREPNGVELVPSWPSYFPSLSAPTHFACPSGPSDPAGHFGPPCILLVDSVVLSLADLALAEMVPATLSF
jgi:hypothetical protein